MTAEVESLPPPRLFNPAAQVGATAPLGFFDPLGCIQVDNEEHFRNLRAAEIKHGRVAMMASIGLVAQHYVQLPGLEKVPAGLGAVGTEEGRAGLAALILVSGIVETGVWTQ